MRAEYICIVLSTLIVVLLVLTDMYFKSVNDLMKIIKEENSAIFKILDDMGKAHDKIMEEYKEIHDAYVYFLTHKEDKNE